MKIILGSFMLLVTSAMAQVTKPAITDDLFIEKNEMAAKYFPASNVGFRYAAYQIPPAEFLSRLDQFKKAAYKKASEQSSVTRQLIIGDINAYSLILLDNYRSNYGIDSAKQAYYYSLMRDDKPDSAQRQRMEEANKAMFTKKLTAADSTRLEAVMNQKLDLSNAQLYKRSASYRRVMDNKIRNILYRDYKEELSNGEDDGLLKMAVVKKLTSNQFIRDYYANDVVQDVINRTKDNASVEKVCNALLPQIKEPYYLENVKKAYQNFMTYADGKPAPNFIYQDVNGKKVSLKDLRGKYVYIDLWATWCGPCKAEIPFLTKIEESFKDKNIYFVSISLDHVANHDQWKSYVVNNKLNGIQLMVDKDFKSTFIESFNISYIPRFILIDPAGNIKDSNAKRPSDPDLKKQLSELL